MGCHNQYSKPSSLRCILCRDEAPLPAVSLGAEVARLLCQEYAPVPGAPVLQTPDVQRPPDPSPVAAPRHRYWCYNRAFVNPEAWQPAVAAGLGRPVRDGS